MDASVTKTNRVRLRRFSLSPPLFVCKLIRELTCLLVTVCILSSQSLAEEQDFLEEFLKREYSLAKPYRGLGFSSSSQWDLMGTAMVTPDHVRLTPDLQSRQGAVWSRIPLTLRDWELKVHFKIHGQGKKNLNGDGLAIWLTKDRMQNGPVFGSTNQFVGLGVFVDTYPNNDRNHDRTQPGTQRAFPYVSVMLGNGTLTYDHDSDGRTTELGGCTAMTRNAIYDTFLLIRYSKNRLTVMVDVDGRQQWKDCADIIGLRLPNGYFFGASSATGDLSDNHDIISMKLYQLTVEGAPEEEEEEVTIPSVDNMKQFQGIDIQEEGMSGVQFFLTLLFSIMGLGVLAVVGLILYGRWKENKRKRFY
ncbi:lectin, mannose-binding 2-like b isoform X1 [Halichoeres trimaculatus]|uniref:lectin, mannose-binding 2-like b isoform X1 n=1 Tax=Halichoeres trimaculatus TaxID=147232 RepID=UPI003D9F0C4D